MAFYGNETVNDLFEGFAKDLLEKIAAKCRFKYEIRIEKDYGKEDPITKKWNGKQSKSLAAKKLGKF